MQTFFKIIGALTLVAGVGYAFYRLYDRKYADEFLFKKNRCDNDDIDFCDDTGDGYVYDEAVYFEDIDDDSYTSEKIDADDFMTEEEIKNQDKNDENAEF